ncbi:MAG: phage tail tape measure protein [Oscillospiraceae bacterium]|nr:phage tail tape measure protein [Oscillospiraceae bacterium]
MASNKKINGITIAINADTSGVTSGLKDLTSQSVSLTKQLKSVESLLKMDPGNTDLIATRQKLLAESVDTTRKRLEALKGAQEDVQAAMERGDIGTDEYIAFQKELVLTEKRMKELGDETEDTGKDMEKAEKQSGKFGEALKNGLATGAKVAAAAIAAMATAAVATAAKLVDLTGDTAEYGDNVDKMSQKLGMSAQAYQEWDFIMQHAGSDIDKMSTSMKKLAEAVQDPSKDAAAAFDRLGISLEKAKEMSQEELFETTIKALQGLESGTERTALANDLLGKSAMDLGALLNQSAEETEAMRQQVHDLGGVMSDEAVKASAAYKDSLQNMKTAIQGVGRSVSSDFMPSITKIMDGISMLASGNDEAVETLEAGFDDFVKNVEGVADKIAEVAETILPILVDALVRNLPKLLEAATRIISTLAKSLLDNLPLIIDAAGKIILDLAKGLIQALPKIIKVGLEVVTKLAQGIVDALPELIPVAVSAILEIAKALTDPKTLIPLIRAALDIITALVEGLLSPESVNAMAEALPEIVENICDIIIDSIDLLLDAAVKLIEALCDYFFEPANLAKIIDATFKIVVKLVEGIIKAVWKLGEAAFEIYNTLVDALAAGWDRLKQAGADMVERIMDGVKEKWDSWVGWWEDIGGYIYDKLHPGGDSLIDFGGGEEPAMATGGLVTRPTRALIGEAGAEVVLPLERNTHWMDILAEKISGSGGAGVTIGEINVDVRGVGEAENIGYRIVAKIDEALSSYQVQQARGYGGNAL